MPPASAPTALILGLTGSIGGAIAQALADRGWNIRALSRRPAGRRPGFPFAVDWRSGDALDAASVLVASEGVALVVHGANPPGYRRWREDGLPMLANAIAAAKARGATILFPANIYVFSAESPPCVDETAPREPATRKGSVRLEMEEMLAQAARRDGVRVIALRAGDFFGPGVANSWFSQAMAKGGAAATSIRTLTPSGVAHAWAYVPDLAEAFARLVDRRDALAPFTLLHFGGHVDRTGREMAEAIHRALGRAGLPIKPFSWAAVRVGALFVPFLREAREMIWLWKTSLALDNAALRRLIGDEPHTPLDDAVARALAGTHPA